MKLYWAVAVAVLLAFAGGAVLGREVGDHRLAPTEARERLLALFREEGGAAAPELAKALEDGRALVRRTAAHLLARIGEPGRPALEAALEHEDSQVRRIALEAMGRERLLGEFLRQAADDPDPAVGAWVWAYLFRAVPEGEPLSPRAAGQLAGYLAEAPPERRSQALRVLKRWQASAQPLYDFAADGVQERLGEWTARKDTEEGRFHAGVRDILRQPPWEDVAMAWAPEGGLRVEFRSEGRLRLGAWPPELRELPPGPYLIRFGFRQEFPDPENATGISLRVGLTREGETEYVSLRPLPRLSPGETLTQTLYLTPNTPGGNEPFRIRFDINLSGPGAFMVEDLAVVPLLPDAP